MQDIFPLQFVGFSFASPVSRPSRFLMVRRGWRSADVPDGWVQVIRGPRPRSVTGCFAAVSSRSSAEPAALSAQSPIVKTSGTRPFGDPQVRVAKLEAALAALHGVDGPEVESLRAALKLAKEVKVQRVDVQIKECEGFLSRARAHMAELDVKRTTVRANIHDAEKRLEALKQMQQFSPPPPVDADAEPRQLREKVAQLQGQLEGVKPALAEGQASMRICRREDVVPNCVEELQEWIGGRQADLHRRGREDQQHHGARSTTVATRSCSWDDAIDGDEQCELRSTYGLRGVRVGEA